jgi:hypothetical protein
MLFSASLPQPDLFAVANCARLCYNTGVGCSCKAVICKVRGSWWTGPTSGWFRAQGGCSTQRESSLHGTWLSNRHCSDRNLREEVMRSTSVQGNTDPTFLRDVPHCLEGIPIYCPGRTGSTQRESGRGPCLVREARGARLLSRAWPLLLHTSRKDTRPGNARSRYRPNPSCRVICW